MPTLESWVEDVQLVMDTVGSERAAVLAPTWVGPLAALFAAICPKRTSALVLMQTFARLRFAPTYRCGLADKLVDEIIDRVRTEWGTGNIWAAYAPGLASDDRLRRWWNRCHRLSISPATAVAFTTMMANSDVRSVLPSIQAPTLIVGFDRNLAAMGQYLVEHIPDARTLTVEAPGTFPWLCDSLAGHIEEFLTGTRRGPDSDRVLATLVFTDVVGSTQRAAAIGDRRWRDILDQYDTAVDRCLAPLSGRRVKNTGDGTLATFDGPARAVRFAETLHEAVRELGLELRCGVHTGEIERRDEDVSGIAVHLAQRVSGLALPNETLVSRTVVDLVAGSGIEFADRGEHALKGVPSTWRLFAVVHS